MKIEERVKPEKDKRRASKEQKVARVGTREEKKGEKRNKCERRK